MLRHYLINGEQKHPGEVLLVLATVAHFLGQPDEFLEFVDVFCADLDVPVIENIPYTPLITIGAQGRFA
jgi:hypothetical protein